MITKSVIQEFNRAKVPQPAWPVRRIDVDIEVRSGHTKFRMIDWARLTGLYDPGAFKNLTEDQFGEVIFELENAMQEAMIAYFRKLGVEPVQLPGK